MQTSARLVVEVSVGTAILRLGGFRSWCMLVVVVVSGATNSEEVYGAMLRANE
jgi:hypothetical protein